jgi:addiction module HigA family antidote
MASQPVPINRGHVLRDRVLPIVGLSVSDTAWMLRISRQTLHAILAGTASVSPAMAMQLARLFDTRPEFWLCLQQQHDLRSVEEELSDVLQDIPLHPLPDALRIEIGFHGHAH